MSFPIIHRFVQGGGEEEEKEDNLSITLKAREIHSVALIQAGKNNSFYKQLRDDINDTIINISVGGGGREPNPRGAKTEGRKLSTTKCR